MRYAFAIVVCFGMTLGVTGVRDAGAEKTRTAIQFSTLRRHQAQRYQLSVKGRRHGAPAWRAYRHRARMPNGLAYGDSVRELDLSNMTASEIDELLSKRGFTREVTALRDKQGEPIVVGGAVVPIVIYTHPDGGTVRVKPEGDPTSRYIKQPHLVKSLRWPYDAPGDGFEHEALKVSNQGAPLPRNTAETRVSRKRVGTKTYFDIWAGLAHTDLRVEAP